MLKKLSFVSDLKGLELVPGDIARFPNVQYYRFEFIVPYTKRKYPSIQQPNKTRICLTAKHTCRYYSSIANGFCINTRYPLPASGF